MTSHSKNSLQPPGRWYDVCKPPQKVSDVFDQLTDQDKAEAIEFWLDAPYRLYRESRLLNLSSDLEIVEEVVVKRLKAPWETFDMTEPMAQQVSQEQRDIEVRDWSSVLEYPRDLQNQLQGSDQFIFVLLKHCHPWSVQPLLYDWQLLKRHTTRKWFPSTMTYCSVAGEIFVATAVEKDDLTHSCLSSIAVAVNFYGSLLWAAIGRTTYDEVWRDEFDRFFSFRELMSGDVVWSEDVPDIRQTTTQILKGIEAAQMLVTVCQGMGQKATPKLEKPEEAMAVEQDVVDGIFSTNELARMYGLKADALRKRVERASDRSWYIKFEDRARRDPLRRYYHAKVLPIIQKMKADNEKKKSCQSHD